MAVSTRDASGKGQIRVRYGKEEMRGDGKEREQRAEEQGSGRKEAEGQREAWRTPAGTGACLEERWILTISLPSLPCVPSQERPLGQDEIEGICPPNALRAPTLQLCACRPHTLPVPSTANPSHGS